MLLIVRTIGLALFFFAHSSFDYDRKKQHQEQERKSKNELAMKEKIRAIENENQRLEEIKILEEKQKLDAMLAFRMKQERQFAEEHRLKSRSVEDAVNAALKHFM